MWLYLLFFMLCNTTRIEWQLHSLAHCRHSYWKTTQPHTCTRVALQISSSSFVVVIAVCVCVCCFYSVCYEFGCLRMFVSFYWTLSKRTRAQATVNVVVFDIRFDTSHCVPPSVEKFCNFLCKKYFPEYFNRIQENHQFGVLTIKQWSWCKVHAWFN